MFRLSLLTLAASLAVPAVVGHAQDISLSVDASQTPQKILHVHAVFPAHAGPMTFYYPKWIPGEHGADGPISSLTGLHFSANGQPVPWNRDLLDVFTFHVNVPDGATRVEANYDYIEAPGFSATDKLLMLEWNEVALYPAGTPSRELTYNVSITLPDGWKYGTSLPVASGTGSRVTFRPITFNLLVDSPILAGQYYRAIDITPPGESVHHELDLAADSEAALGISPTLQKDMVNLVAQAGRLFGTRHYRDYHFLLALSDHVQHFGLEHHESNDSRLPERALISPNAAFLVGSLLPHEYVHSWNGKFRRPADLTTPDFEKPMETDLLWVYEGLTDYLGPMLAARSGFWTPEEYHEYLASIAAMLGPGRPGRTWRDLQDTATAEPMDSLGAGFARGWMNWRRGTDYYDEGDLLWLEVATILHQTTHGQKSIDDFCHLFHGGANDGPQTKTYTFDQVVDALNTIAPYDWTHFLRERLDSLSPDAPVGGIENGGWKVIFNNQPSHLAGRRGNFGDAYTIGLQVGEGGNITDSIVGSAAYRAGITSGMKLVGVNGRVYTHDDLEDAIQAAQTNRQPIRLMVIIDDYYHTFNVDYTGGERVPHLVRDDSKPDYLDELIQPRGAAE